MVRLCATAVLAFSLSVYAAAAGEKRNNAIPAGFNTSVGDPNGVSQIGNAQGKQFITGACLSNADCASGCCAGLNGGAVCSGVGAQTQNGKQGCGFGDDAAANNDTGNANNGNANNGNSNNGNSNNGTDSGNAASGSSANAAVPAGFNTAVGDPAGVKNFQNGKGQQFIGGICISDADCASACCAGKDGGAVCSGPGAQFQNGKQGCGFKAAKRSVGKLFNA